MSIKNFISQAKANTFNTESSSEVNKRDLTINETYFRSNEKDREFDLNIEKILESWEVFHAIREIIANALDEQIITNTKDISIHKSKDGFWHIVDYGRGLNYHHLTQNENEEKLNNDKLIGRFGVGLKDALATLYRHGIKVEIKSKYGNITLKKASKAGFNDIITLHADITPPEDYNMIGTDFCLEGCSDEDIIKAKALFLKFSDSTILEKTIYGQVIEKDGEIADIYINGVKVSEEQNFLFSYNITSLTTKLKKSLNRERTNVGRTAYTDRIKSILLECNEESVIRKLIDDLQQFGIGTKHDELSWQDVQLYASQKLKKFYSNSTFITSDDLQKAPSIIDEMKRSGYNPVVIPSNLANKMEDYNKGAKDGETFTTTNQFISEIQSKFKPIFIDIDKLTKAEKKVYEKTDQILQLIGGKPRRVKEIKITEKIFEQEFYYETVGLWEPNDNRILIKRKQLCSVSEYASTLLHECAHAMSDAGDMDRDFETELTKIIGIIASKIIK